MQAGTLRHYVTIEHLTGSTPDGFGNVRKTWTAFYSNVPAEITPATSKEIWAGTQEKTSNTHVVVIRYGSGIDTTMRVVYGSRIFTINGILNKDERNIELTLLCREEVQ